MGQKTIYLIAGEASGDNLGSRLISALKELSTEPLAFQGVGGEKMAQHGFVSLFPMSDLSLVGFIEIIPHIPKLLKRINEVLIDIESVKPDVVITIDAPAFNFRIARKLRERGYQGKLVHYVAPSVWAYKPERALLMKQWYDHVMALLPFEPPYFEKAELPCTFVGHPIVEEPFTGGNSEAYYKKYRVDPKAPVLVVYPGSRKGELKRHLSIVYKTVQTLHTQVRNLHIAIIATPSTSGFVQNHVNKWRGMDVRVISDPKEKYNALATASAGLIKSGTSTLEVALAGVAMVVFYKVNPLSAHMLRSMITVHYVSIINIIANSMVLPEFLQERCDGNLIALELEKLLRGRELREVQHQKSMDILNKLGYKMHPLPSQRAAICAMDVIGIKHKSVEEKNLHTPAPEDGLSLPKSERRRAEEILAMEASMHLSAANMIELPDAPKKAPEPTPQKAAEPPKPEKKETLPDTGSTTEGF